MNILISLTLAGVVAMMGGVFGYRKIVLPLSILALTGTLVLCFYAWDSHVSYFNRMLLLDNFSLSFSMVCIAGALFSIGLFHFYYENFDHYPEAIALILFSLTGVVALTSFTNLLMLFLGIEILSLSLYILAGIHKKDLLSNEASLKYFLMGAFSTGFLLMGMALVYAATGSFDHAQIAERVQDVSGNTTLVAGMLLLLVGLLFKVSAVPFQFWAPDVYEGSPTLITGYMATAGKVAAFAALLRIFQQCFVPLHAASETAVWLVAAATMLFGNLAAIYQSSVKRMLAYSSISHAGYMLMVLVTINEFSNEAALFYGIAYTLASISSFAVVHMVQGSNSRVTPVDFNGLLRTNPVIAGVLIVSMLSLAGIPATAGFFAKFYVFSSAVYSGYIWLVVLGVLSSFISVYYYFKPVIAACMKEPSGTAVTAPSGVVVLLVLLTVLTLFFGIFPGLVSGIL